MKLSNVLLNEMIGYDPDFEREVDKIEDQGGKKLGCGDYGCAYLLKGRAVKVTTDADELEHALILRGKNTENFVHIYSVEKINDKLGIITMDVLGDYNSSDIPDDWKDDLESEAQAYGIDPDELDVRPSNIMVDPNTGDLKMIDV